MRMSLSLQVSSLLSSHANNRTEGKVELASGSELCNVFPQRFHRSKLLVKAHVFEKEIEGHGLMYTSGPYRFKSIK